MKLTIEKGALHKALALATSVVERRNTIPILANVLIEAKDGEIWLTATDLDIETRTRVDGVIEAEGAITAVATLLSDIVRNAPDGAEISVEKPADDPRLIVRFGRSRYQVPILPAQDFPRKKPAEAPAVLRLDALQLATLMQRTAFAMSVEQTRYYLCGAFLHLLDVDGQPKLRMAATCGGRLAMAQISAPSAAPEFQGVIVPSKTVGEFLRLLNGRAGEVEVRVTPQEVALETEETVIRSKVIDGDYPDYARVIPTTWEHEIEVDRALLASAARRVSLVDNGKVRAVKLIAENGILTLTSRSLEYSQATEEIEVEGTPERVEVAFNARFLLDAIEQTEADRVVLRCGEKGGPTRLEVTADDPEHGDALAILMPMAV